jgi:acetyl-CoA synthetase
MADVGWITGHSYIVYGPLSIGATTVLFESIPTYPDASRYWDMVQRLKMTHLYTAPTAIRALKRLGDEWVHKHDLSSLRVLGSVGEPINPEVMKKRFTLIALQAWHWYNTVVGKGKCAVVDTYWQTETGSFLIAPYASVTPTKAGSASLPQFGIQPVLLDATTGQPLSGYILFLYT